MKLRLISGFTAAVCLSLAACHPYKETQTKPTKGTDKPTATPDELKKKQEEEAKKKQEEELKKKEEEAKLHPPVPNPDPNPKPNPEPQKRDYVVANKVPGKDGFVFSPYNNKVVDVREIPSGTLVADPTYPAAEKKYFRVP